MDIKMSKELFSSIYFAVSLNQEYKDSPWVVFAAFAVFYARVIPEMFCTQMQVYSMIEKMHTFSSFVDFSLIFDIWTSFGAWIQNAILVPLLFFIVFSRSIHVYESLYLISLNWQIWNEFLSAWLLLPFLQVRDGTEQQHCIGMAKLPSWSWSRPDSVLLTASDIGHLAVGRAKVYENRGSTYSFLNSAWYVL